MNKFEQKLFYPTIFLFILALCFVFNVVDPDFFARIMQGDAFWQTGHILFNDPFSYTETHKWIDHEWGSSVIFAFVQNIFGYGGQILLKAIILFLIIFFSFKIINLNEKMKEKPINILFCIFLIYAFQTLLVSGIRCHFFTFLLFTVFLYILELVRKQNKTKLLYILPLMMIIWCNIHGGCVSGIGLIVMYAVGEALNKKPFVKYILPALLCFLATFVNPYGIEYVKFLLMATTMNRADVNEWKPLFSTSFTSLLPFKIFITGTILLFIERITRDIKGKIDYTEYITLLAVIYLGLAHIKQTPFVAIVATAYLYKDLCHLYERAKFTQNIKNTNSVIRDLLMKTLYIFFISISVILIFTGSNVPKNIGYFPYKTMEFIKDNNLRGKILNEFGTGSYIAYKLYPEMLIFIDGRYEEVYYDISVKQNDNFYIPNDNWAETLKVSGGADYVIVRQDFMAYENMLNEAKKGNYKEIFNDGIFALFAKNEIVKQSYIHKKYTREEYGKLFFNKIYNFGTNG